jgi:hypothetical protein
MLHRHHSHIPPLFMSIFRLYRSCRKASRCISALWLRLAMARVAMAHTRASGFFLHFQSQNAYFWLLSVLPCRQTGLAYDFFQAHFAYGKTIGADVEVATICHTIVYAR